MDRRRRITHNIARLTMLGAALSGVNIKAFSKLVKANEHTPGSHLVSSKEDLMESDAEFLERLIQNQQSIAALAESSAIIWTLKLESDFRDAIDSYIEDLVEYTLRLSQFYDAKQNYEALKTSQDPSVLKSLLADIEVEYHSLMEAYEVLFLDYGALSMTQSQRTAFFGEDNDISTWILAQMGYDYEQDQLYQVNYSYDPATWRRIYSVPGGYEWTTKGEADIFNMGISPKGDPSGTIPSFCAYLGSHHFSGEGGIGTGIGYLLDVNPFDNNFASQDGRDMTPEQYARIISAYNYIFDVYGQLDGDYRVVTQMVTWMLLDTQFNFDAIQEGSGGTLAVLQENGFDFTFGGLTENERRIILEVLHAVDVGYQGLGQIYAFLYLVGIDSDGVTLADPMQAQPQIVPIYTVDVPVVLDFLPPEMALMDVVELEDILLSPIETPPSLEEEKNIEKEVDEILKEETLTQKKSETIRKVMNEMQYLISQERLLEVDRDTLRFKEENKEISQEQHSTLPETGERIDSFHLIGGALGFASVVLALYRKYRREN